MAGSSEFPDELDLSKFIYHTGSWYNPDACRNLLKPSQVFKKDSKPYNHLVCSKLIRCIPIKNLHDIEGLKPVVVETTNGSAFFNHYDVLCVKCFAHYYSQIPSLDYDPKVFELVHFIYRCLHCLSKKSVMDFGDKAYNDFSERGLHRYICQLAMVLLPNDAKCVDILDHEALSTLSILDELKERSFELYTIYNVIGYYVKVGVGALDPVPLCLRYDHVLEIYVNSIARVASRDTVEMSHSFPPLHLDLPSKVFTDLDEGENMVNSDFEEMEGKIDEILKGREEIMSKIDEVLTESKEINGKIDKILEERQEMRTKMDEINEKLNRL